MLYSQNLSSNFVVRSPFSKEKKSFVVRILKEPFGKNNYHRIAE